MIFYQTKLEYEKCCEENGITHHWYGYPRGWTDLKDIYINKDAFYINDRDRKLLLYHEEGHIAGKNHTLLGLMSAYGLIRFFTTFSYF